MRVNVYAEEMTDRLEIIGKEIDGHTFTGLRFYLELPVSYYKRTDNGQPSAVTCTPSDGDSRGAPYQLKGPFVHRLGDDDSSAVTFWGKRDLRQMLRKALAMLDAHYGDAQRDDDARVVDARSEHGWRVSRSGYSIKTGWGDEKKIIAQIPATTPKELVQAWIDAAGDIVEAHNASMQEGTLDG